MLSFYNKLDKYISENTERKHLNGMHLQDKQLIQWSLLR